MSQIMGDCWHQEYPRPQFRRDSFFSLDGKWQLNGAPIHVPFAPEAKLSGYRGRERGSRLSYRRYFRLPEGFAGEDDDILLHFGAVDQRARVRLNGRVIAKHEGGYLPFSINITRALVPGENQLCVDVIDSLSHAYPYGKQHRRPHGMWYTPVSGIWQSVWIEAVPRKGRIQELRITPSLDQVEILAAADSEELTIAIGGEGIEKPFVMTATGLPGLLHMREGRTCLEAPGCEDPDIPMVGQRFRIRMEDTGLPLHHWTPEHPYLYTLTLETATDQVESYFALRTIDTGVKNGKPVLLLNGEPIFLHGVLDQGYFLDGHYLPEEPAEYRRDICRMKSLGFNCLRKHIKIEPEVFYYACDREGMLVIQDMVQNGGYSWILDTALPNLGFQKRSDHRPGWTKRRMIFVQHMKDTLEHLYNHPCIVIYTIFNEGWGQFDSDRMYRICRKLDGTRLYNSTSGWFAQKESNFDSVHAYFRNRKLTAGTRPLLISECGGYVRKIEGHLWKSYGGYGYGTAKSREELTRRIEALYEEMVLPSIADGACGCIYTQLSDVEGEINGLYTYDRKVCKVEKERIRAIAERIHMTRKQSER